MHTPNVSASWEKKRKARWPWKVLYLNVLFCKRWWHWYSCYRMVGSSGHTEKEELRGQTSSLAIGTVSFILKSDHLHMSLSSSDLWMPVAHGTSELSVSLGSHPGSKEWFKYGSIAPWCFTAGDCTSKTWWEERHGNTVISEQKKGQANQRNKHPGFPYLQLLYPSFNQPWMKNSREKITVSLPNVYRYICLYFQNNLF